MPTIYLPDPLALLTPSAVVSALLTGVRFTDDLDVALEGRVPWFVWMGKTPGDDAGRFWIPALFPSHRLPVALREVAEDRRKRGKPYDFETCRDAMAAFHSGLGKRHVGKCPWAFAEIDHLPRAEQEARYDALAAATGLRWALKLFSGGKSVHAYLAFTVPLDAADPLRLEIQRLLVVVLEGDTRITDPGRLMRLPGWDGPRRKQPVVHFDREARFHPRDVRNRLHAYAVALGLADVDVAFGTLQLAEALELEAKHDGADAAHELREHAAVLRATRSNPSDADVKLGRAMLGKTVRAIVASAGSKFAKAHSGSNTTVYLSVAEMAAYANLPRLTSVHRKSSPRHPWQL